MADPDKQEKTELIPSHKQEIKTYTPDEILGTRDRVTQRVGETIYPQDRAGEIVRLSNELARLRQNQIEALQSFEARQIPATLPLHDDVAKKYNELQIQQLNAMQAIINAQKKAKINETKAGNLNAANEVSQFNRNRILEYSKTGAKALGNIAKYLGIGIGATAFWISKLGLEIVKETFNAGADIFYSIWGAHKSFREEYPKDREI